MKQVDSRISVSRLSRILAMHIFLSKIPNREQGWLPKVKEMHHTLKCIGLRMVYVKTCSMRTQAACVASFFFNGSPQKHQFFDPVLPFGVLGLPEPIPATAERRRGAPTKVHLSITEQRGSVWVLKTHSNHHSIYFKSVHCGLFSIKRSL